MRLPSKVTTYQESILSKFPIILKKLQTDDYNVLDLYNAVKTHMTLREFHESLVCLFALNEITVDKEIIHYAQRDIL